MRGDSIRFRLWSAAAISILVALAVAGVGLRYLFERHVERRIERDLTVDLNQLIAGTGYSNGVLEVRVRLPDPRFEVPLSGYFWQVADPAGGAVIRSRSLWEAALTLPADVMADGRRAREITAADGRLLIAVARTIVDENGQSFQAIVAEDHRAIARSVNEYVGELAPALLLLGLVLIAAIFVQITVGLAPLDALRVAVSDVVARRRARLDAPVPREVRPLAEEIDRLLEAQEKALVRARSRATDLAHGMKTPLQVLSADIRSLRQKGETGLAEEIDGSVATIRRHIERELARARIAPPVSGTAECRVADVAEQIISVVRRSPGGERLAFQVDAASDLVAPIDADDFSEILGNLLDNAVRFARSSVRVEATGTAMRTIVSVVDDGPGIADADKASALSRGVRLDTNGSGSGLGLAIVSDIVDAYGGQLTMGDAPHGLRVTITLPARS